MHLVYFFTFFGSLLVIVGLYKTISHYYKVNNYKKVDGFFSDYIVKKFNSRYYHSNLFFPIVTYEISGKKYKKEYNKGFRDEFSASNCIGKRVSVFYNENNPVDSTFFIEKSYFLIIIGLLFLIFPIIVFVELFK